MDLRHFVVDVQILMIASGLSDPPDDGTAIELLKAIENAEGGRIVWDSGNLIRSQYESKLRQETFGRDWLIKILLSEKVVEVERFRFSRAQKTKIMKTGLIGEDLNYYVRTAANSPDRILVSEDSDYDDATCKTLKKVLDVRVVNPAGGEAFLSADESED